MIRLQSIRICNFRGIRELDLNFGGKNYAIQGPNAPGRVALSTRSSLYLPGKSQDSPGRVLEASRLSGTAPMSTTETTPAKET